MKQQKCQSALVLQQLEYLIQVVVETKCELKGKQMFIVM